MSQITLPGRLWCQLVAAAKTQRKRPETLAVHAIEAYLARFADEELLQRSVRKARKNSMSLEAIEGVLKRRVKADRTCYSSAQVLKHVRRTLRRKLKT
jgi:hypothetical protein